MQAQVTIGVAGLGAMGLGIAQVYAQAGFTVLAFDPSDTARRLAPARIAAALEARVMAGRMSAAESRDTQARIRIGGDLAVLAPCTLVIEAIVENSAAKADLFARLEDTADPAAVLATNTSSLSVASLATPLRHPARMLGLHFFNPAPAMRLVELVTHPGTSAAALKLAETITVAAGKTVIRCADRPGFIVNRCARPFYGEALALLEEGVPAMTIDGAMLAAGYRLGPFALIDLVGVDIHLAATEGVRAGMGGHPRYHVFDVLRAQVARGDLGRKTGCGFVFPETPVPLPDAGIAARIEATLLNEAASLLAEGTSSADDIDRALKLGLNFPRGPFERHIAPALTLLAALEAKAPPHLKGRYVASGSFGRLP